MNSNLPCISRRRFIGATAAIATTAALGNSSFATGQSQRTIKLGVVGNGGRGSWIAKLFAQHGGYEMYAVADYFQEVADACGESLGVARTRRFSGLGGYQKLIESGVEAVALETPPYFFPHHAKAAVEAGCHVYMDKPVAGAGRNRLLLAPASSATAVCKSLRPGESWFLNQSRISQSLRRTMSTVVPVFPSSPNRGGLICVYRFSHFFRIDATATCRTEACSWAW